jgi:hypothetical protein
MVFPVVLSDDQLPPGFVPLSTTPTPTTTSLPAVSQSLSPINFGGNLVLPGPFVSPAMANLDLGTNPGDNIDNGGAPSKKKGKRKAAKRLGPADSDEEAEVSSSISSDRETLTTPRTRGGGFPSLPAPDVEEPPVIPRQTAQSGKAK